MNDLIPLKTAAERLGLSAKTLRNRAARARAGLPGWHLELVKIGERLYVRTGDLDLFLAGLGQAEGDDPKLEIQVIADQISRVFPEESEHLRSIAATIPPRLTRSRKRKPRTVLRAVESEQPEVSP